MVEVTAGPEGVISGPLDVEDLWEPKERLEFFLQEVQDASDKWGVECTLTTTIEITPGSEEAED